MKRTILIAMALVALATAVAVAEPIPDKWILTPRVGYAWMKSNDDGKGFEGMVASASIERNVYGQNYALGFSAGYAWATDEVDTEDGTINIDHTSIPILATGLGCLGISFLWQSPLLARGKTKTVSAIAVSSALVNLGADTLLIPRMGGVGAAWGTLIAFAFMLGMTMLVSWRFRDTGRRDTGM